MIYNLQKLKIDYRKFLKKYDFDYLFVDKEEVLYKLLEIDSVNYVIVMDEDNHVLFKKQ